MEVKALNDLIDVMMPWYNLLLGFGPLHYVHFIILPIEALKSTQTGSEPLSLEMFSG